MNYHAATPLSALQPILILIVPESLACLPIGTRLPINPCMVDLGQQKMGLACEESERAEKPRRDKNQAVPRCRFHFDKAKIMTGSLDGGIMRIPGSITYHDATANVADVSTRTGNDAFTPQFGSEITMQC